MRTRLLLLALANSALAVAQSPAGFQLVIDPPTDMQYTSWIDGAVTIDGESLMLGGYQNSPESAFTLTKYSVDGEPVWSRKVETTNADYGMQPRKVVLLSNGDPVVFGVMLTNGGLKFFVVRMGANGDLLWARLYLANNNGNEYGFSSIVTTISDDLIISMGFNERTVMMRLDMNGDMEWARSYLSDLGPGAKNPGFDFTDTPDDGMLLTEKAMGDIYLVRADANGDVVWAYRYPNGQYNHAKTAIRLSDGGFVVAGLNDLWPFAMRLDAFGTVIWQKRYVFDEGYPEYFAQALELSDGGFLFTPSSNALGIFGLRVSPLGTPVEAITLSGGGYAEVIGQHEGSVLFGGRTQVTGDGGLEDVFLFLRLNEALEMDCLRGTTSATATDLTTSLESGCNVLDEPVSVTDFITLVSYPEFVTRPLCEGLISVTEHPTPGNMSVFPSPVTAGGRFTIETDDNTSSVECRASNGQLIARAVRRPERTMLEISTHGWAPGLYLLRSIDNAGRLSGTVRLVVE